MDGDAKSARGKRARKRAAKVNANELHDAFDMLGAMYFAFTHRHPSASAADAKLEAALAELVGHFDEFRRDWQLVWADRLYLQLVDVIEWLLLPYYPRAKSRASRPPPHFVHFTPCRGPIEPEIRAAYNWYRVASGRQIPGQDRYLRPLDEAKMAVIRARLTPRPEYGGVRQSAAGLAAQLVDRAGPTIPGDGRASFAGHGRGAFSDANAHRRGGERGSLLGAIAGPLFFGAELGSVEVVRFLARSLGASEGSAAFLELESPPLVEDMLPITPPTIVELPDGELLVTATAAIP